MRSCRFSQCLGLVNILTTKRCSETGLAMHSSNHVFRSEEFQKYLNYEGQAFFENVQNFMYIRKIQGNIDRKCLFFKKNAFELLAVNSQYYSEKKLVSAVNGLTNSPGTSDSTLRDVVQLCLCQIDEKVE